LARPGEAVLANHGVLFMDEMPLFRRDVLESLRAPLEDGVVRIARSGGVVSFPCRFSLVGALNPCPCGYLEDDRRSCRCSPQTLQAYRGRLSGPLLDRFDIQVPMTRLTADDLVRAPDGESSSQVRERVETARAAQRERFGPSATNASASKTQLRLRGRFDPRAFSCLGPWVDSGKLTGRGFERVLRVARTLADLEGSPDVLERHVMEAVPYRAGDDCDEVAA
jgi:magnesium chelatase family protein